MTELLGLILLGVTSGILSALLGVGGGIIIVPVMGIVFKLPQLFIIASSLSVIFLNSSLNTWNFYKKSPIDFKKVALIALVSICSAALASHFGADINDWTLKLIFTCFISFVTLPIALFSYSKKDKKMTMFKLSNNRTLSTILIGFVTGTISGLTGLGGGVILVPLLHAFLQIDYKRVSSYSNAIMVFTTFSGVLTYSLSSPQEQIQFYSIGYIIPQAIGSIFIGAFFGSKLGIYLNQKISRQKLALGYIIVITSVVVKSIYQILYQI